MISTVTSVIALAVSVIALGLTLRRERDRDHFEFIATKDELVKTFLQQVFALQDSMVSLMDALPSAPAALTDEIAHLIEVHSETTDQAKEILEKLSSVPTDSKPSRAERLALARMQGHASRALERSDYVRKTAAQIVELTTGSAANGQATAKRR